MEATTAAGVLDIDDPQLEEKLVGELKSQGIFDQLRKDCLADVDTTVTTENSSALNPFLKTDFFAYSRYVSMPTVSILTWANSTAVSQVGLVRSGWRDGQARQVTCVDTCQHP